MGKIFYLMGKSSCGKDTIYRQLLCRNPDLLPVVPYTTRPIRDGEQDGREYHFVDESVFLQMEQAGQILESRSYQTNCGVWIYFTANDGQIDLSAHSYLMIGTLASYQSMRVCLGRDALIPIYIEVDDGLRLERALMRERMQNHPKYGELCRRFLADEVDFSEEHLADAGLDVRFENRDLESCVAEVEGYIRKQSCALAERG